MPQVSLLAAVHATHHLCMGAAITQMLYISCRW